MVLKSLIIFGLLAGSAAKHKGKHDGHHSGDANIETVWKIAKMARQMNNADVAPGLKLLAEYEGFFAPKVSCSQHTPKKMWRYDLHDVTLADCAAADAKQWMDTHIIDIIFEDVFADESGTAVMARVVSVVNLIGGQPLRFPAFCTWTFNDAGKITGMRTDTVSSPLAPNGRNIETVWKLGKVVSEMNNADIGSGIVAKLLPEFEGFFAPKVSCAQHTSSKMRRFDLHDVPLADCTEAATKALMDWHVIDMTYEDVFADEAGTAVMARVMFQGNLPGGPPARFPIIGTYHFDNAGKITSYIYEMDSTPLSPIARNTQNVWQLAKVMSKLNNADIGSGILAKLLPEFEGFFTQNVSCAQYATREAQRYDLQDVPLSDCMAADTKAWMGLHVTDFTFANVFADESGTPVMARAEFKGNAPGGLTVQFPVFFTYTFDNAGKITSYRTDQDSSSLSAPPTPPELAEQYATAPSTSIAITFLVGFIAAALVTGGIAFLISKRSSRDPLLNGNSEI